MLQETVDYVVYTLLGRAPDSKPGQAVNFFIYDSVKILLLLFFMILAIGFLRTYLERYLEKGIASSKNARKSAWSSHGRR